MGLVDDKITALDLLELLAVEVEAAPSQNEPALARVLRGTALLLREEERRGSFDNPLDAAFVQFVAGAVTQLCIPESVAAAAGMGTGAGMLFAFYMERLAARQRAAKIQSN